MDTIDYESDIENIDIYITVYSGELSERYMHYVSKGAKPKKMILLIFLMENIVIHLVAPKHPTVIIMILLTILFYQKQIIDIYISLYKKRRCFLLMNLKVK